MRRTHVPVHRVAPLLLAAALACTRKPPVPVPSPGPEPARAPSSSFTRVADANAVAFFATVNNVDVAYARLAATRASHRDVKAFARRMITDHTSSNSNLNILVLRLDLNPKDSEIAAALREQSEARRDTLRALSGRRFDAAYVANEIRYHQELLVAIDRVFLPSARHPELREFVTTLRPMVSAHLAHAEQVQATLSTRR